MAVVARSGSSSGLVGRWFHSWEPIAEGEDVTHATVRNGKKVVWQGQVLDCVDDDYLVQTYSWLDGAASRGAFLVPREQAKEWTFYKDNEHMIAGLGCSEVGKKSNYDGRVCGAPVTHIIRDGFLGPILRCGSCITYYRGKPQPWPAP